MGRIATARQMLIAAHDLAHRQVRIQHPSDPPFDEMVAEHMLATINRMGWLLGEDGAQAGEEGLRAALERLADAVQAMIEADPYEDITAEMSMAVHRAYEQARAALAAAQGAGE